MAPSLSGEESYSDPTAASDRSRNGTAAGVVQDSQIDPALFSSEHGH